MTVAGPSGTITVGYQVAYTLGAWVLTKRAPHEFRVTARVIGVNPFWATQGPQRLALTLPGGRAWTWGLSDRATLQTGRVVLTLTTPPEGV